jgi:hypothetical protein
MAYYLVDLILVLALLFTSIRVTQMRRQLVRLRAEQGDFALILGKTTEAVDDMALMMREFSDDGKQLVTALGDKIEQARQAIVDIDARSGATHGQAWNDAPIVSAMGEPRDRSTPGARIA